MIFNKSDFKWAEKYAAQVSLDVNFTYSLNGAKLPLVTPMIIDYIKANPQWEFSLQIHKYIDVP